MKLIIEDDEGRKTVVPFVREEISIGRQEGNTIRLTERNVSRKHARLVRHNGTVEVEDLGSFNGVRVNGHGEYEGRLPVQEGDLVEIGDYDLAIESEAADAAGQPAGGARDDGRAPTAPAANGHAVTPVSSRAPTLPGDVDEAVTEDEAAPPRSQSTAVIRTGNLAEQVREVRDLAPRGAAQNRHRQRRPGRTGVRPRAFRSSASAGPAATTTSRSTTARSRETTPSSSSTPTAAGTPSICSPRTASA